MKVGKVIEVYIPNEYKEGKLIDIMERTQIGFKVLVNGEIIDITTHQNEITSNIYKNDKVIINYGLDGINISLYEGDINGK